jgi:hypothetical protein
MDELGQAIHLQVDLALFPPGREAFAQGAIVGQANPISVDHDPVDRLPASVLENLGEFWMDRRLAPGKLQDFGSPLALDEPIDRSAAFVERHMSPSRTARGIAHGAGQIAGTGNFKHRDARVLLM